MSPAKRSFSHEASLGDTFGHRLERIHAVSRSNDPADLDALLAAFADEPDPAVRKLLALAALRVAGLVGRDLDTVTSERLHEACRWALPR